MPVQSQNYSETLQQRENDQHLKLSMLEIGRAVAAVGERSNL